MELKIISFAHLPHKNNGKFLPKPIAGIYAILKNEESQPEFYLISTRVHDHYYHFNKERDVLRICRIGENVDLRYLLFDPPGILEKPLFDVSGYPRQVAEYNTRRSEEDIKKKMGYEADLCWSAGASILSKNYLAYDGETEIICYKKVFGFLRKKNQWIYMYAKDQHPSLEVRAVLKFHGLEPVVYDWSLVN